MPVEVILPKVDMDMETGLISVWHVRDGDRVIKGQPLFDIETDKAAMEVESPADGTLHHISAAAGDTVPIGQAVAWLYAEGEDVGQPPDAPEQVTTSTKVHQPLITAPTPPATAEVGIRATPAARRLARDEQVDLAQIAGTGPQGRVQKCDVDAAVTGAVPVANMTGALSVLRSGKKDGTPMVLIHGFAADATSWGAVMAELSRSGPVIRLELPNHGKSPREEVRDFAGLVSRMRETFDGLGLETAHLVGHSLGGAVALALADTRPRVITKLSLIAPAGLGPEINPDILNGLMRATQANSLAPWLRQMVGDPKLITDNYAGVAARVRSDEALRLAQTAMSQVLFADGTQCFDVSGALDRLSCPARIIWGKSDRMIPWSHALRAPGAVSLNLLEHTGHLPQFEQPELVSKLLRM